MPCKVLVIDDDPITMELMAAMVSREGFDVFQAQSASDGLKMFYEVSPSIVICDYRMPVTDGLEVLKQIKHEKPEVQVILMTAEGNFDAVIGAFHLGALDYLQKPIGEQELSLALRRAQEKVLENTGVRVKPVILIAEDESDVRRRLVRILEDEDWDVVAAEDGQYAVDLFSNQRIDICILDISMPRKDGLQALHEMREKTTDFESIILTGHGDEQEAIQALRDGAFSFLKKPIDVDELVAVIHKALEKLMMSQALKYRTRELQLKNELISQIISKEKVEADKTSPNKYALMMIDAIPVGLIVVNVDLKVLLANEHYSRVTKENPMTIDDVFCKSLSAMGMEMSHEKLTKALESVFSTSPGSVETIDTGTYSYALITRMVYVDKGKEVDAALITLRGERS
ncbi:MAG: response regulator [Planctomycetes bacterium]|nr:response regulator [Planctomycetota bacterium]